MFPRKVIRMKTATASLAFASTVLLAGCTHLVTFTPPAVPTAPHTGASKGTAFIAKVVDQRPAGTDLFVFGNPPHKWIYQSTEKPEDIVHKLMKEALQRRGIAESTSPADTRRVNVELLDFSGQNEPGFWYLGKCLYSIRCGVKIEDPKGSTSFLVTGNGTNYIMKVSDENMSQLLQQTYNDFLQNLGRELGKAGY